MEHTAGIGNAHLNLGTYSGLLLHSNYLVLRYDTMTISVRLPPEEQHMLEVLARRVGRNKSDLMRQAVRELCQRLAADNRTPYSLGQDLFGTGSPAPAPTDPMKRQIWEKLRAKHRRLG